MMMFVHTLDTFLTLYFTKYLSWPDWLFFDCFFSFEYFDPYDHYAACWVTLKESGGGGGGGRGGGGRRGL